ncbi:MAG: hypothetical protein JNM85_06230 [Chthonomonas sp.]|nr:hypothetical protein [Chthonomonas sp.]
MSDYILYRPAEAIQWLRHGAQTMRGKAKRSGMGIVRREGARGIAKDLTQAASAVIEVGKSAVADLMHLQAAATEYTLGPEGFFVNRSTGGKQIPYKDIRTIRRAKDGFLVELERGSVTISPPAHIVAGGVKAPVGWLRNEVEVHFELIGEELAARAQLEILPE